MAIYKAVTAANGHVCGRGRKRTRLSACYGVPNRPTYLTSTLSLETPYLLNSVEMYSVFLIHGTTLACCCDLQTHTHRLRGTYYRHLHTQIQIHYTVLPLHAYELPFLIHSGITFLIHRIQYDVGQPLAVITASTLLGKLSHSF